MIIKDGVIMRFCPNCSDPENLVKCIDNVFTCPQCGWSHPFTDVNRFIGGDRDGNNSQARIVHG